MKIGIMGGTFDPIHNGHIMLGETAYHNFHLDKVWFMPNGHPPHKELDTVEASVEERIQMVQLAIKDIDYFKLQDYEVNRAEVSYTYRTMEYFSKTYPNDEFYFIIGADSLFAIEHWVKPERIFPTCTLLAAYRDSANQKDIMNRQIEYLQNNYHAKISLLETPIVPVSSHELREAIKEGKNIKDYVPCEVAEYIHKNNLYTIL